MTLSSPDAMPPYGDPGSPVIAKLCQIILLSAVRAGATELRLEWRDHPEVFLALRDRYEEVGEEDELLDILPQETGGWVVLQRVGSEPPKRLMVPPEKHWCVVKHRLLCLSGLAAEPWPGWRREEHAGFVGPLGPGDGEEAEFLLRFGLVTGGEQLLLTRRLD